MKQYQYKEYTPKITINEKFKVRICEFEDFKANAIS